MAQTSALKAELPYTFDLLPKKTSIRQSAIKGRLVLNDIHAHYVKVLSTKNWQIYKSNVKLKMLSFILQFLAMILKLQ